MLLLMASSIRFESNFRELLSGLSLISRSSETYMYQAGHVFDSAASFTKHTSLLLVSGLAGIASAVNTARSHSAPCYRFLNISGTSEQPCSPHCMSVTEHNVQSDYHSHLNLCAFVFLASPKPPILKTHTSHKLTYLPSLSPNPMLRPADLTLSSPPFFPLRTHTANLTPDHPSHYQPHPHTLAHQPTPPPPPSAIRHTARRPARPLHG